MSANMIVQIYAFTRIDQALAAVELGVDHIGFVAGDYGLVPGELSFKEARGLAVALAGKAVRVALTMASNISEILRMAEIVGPDIVHVSSDLETIDVAAMETLRHRLPDSIRLMKAVHVHDEGSIQDALRYASVSDILLLDTKVMGMPGIGATGKVHDWSVSRRIIEAVGVPVILAGGLTPENVAQAIAAVKPWGVDSNTGTNRPGSNVEKDMKRIASFVAAVRSAGRE